MAVYTHCCRAQPLRQLGFLVKIYSVRQKISPKVICHFLSNHLEFLREILLIYYLSYTDKQRQTAFDYL